MMNRFVVNHEVPDGFLTVLEQMPGTIAWKDVSQNLHLGGFYFRPTNPQIFFPELGWFKVAWIVDFFRNQTKLFSLSLHEILNLGFFFGAFPFAKSCSSLH